MTRPCPTRTARRPFNRPRLDRLEDRTVPTGWPVILGGTGDDMGRSVATDALAQADLRRYNRGRIRFRGGAVVVTQVTLTLDQAESEALRDWTQRTGRAPEELLGEVVRRFLAPPAQAGWQAALRQVAGIWKDRDDLPPLSELRGEWERRITGTP